MKDLIFYYQFDFLEFKTNLFEFNNNNFIILSIYENTLLNNKISNSFKFIFYFNIFEFNIIFLFKIFYSIFVIYSIFVENTDILIIK